MSKNITGLKRLLETHSMTQSVLADLLGINQAKVSHWATGKRFMSEQNQEEIMYVVKNRKPYIKPVAEITTEEKIKSILEQPMKANTLEGKIKECKKLCLETYGFEILVVKMKDKE